MLFLFGTETLFCDDLPPICYERGVTNVLASKVLGSKNCESMTVMLKGMDEPTDMVGHHILRTGENRQEIQSIPLAAKQRSFHLPPVEDRTACIRKIYRVGPMGDGIAVYKTLQDNQGVIKHLLWFQEKWLALHEGKEDVQVFQDLATGLLYHVVISGQGTSTISQSFDLRKKLQVPFHVCGVIRDHVLLSSKNQSNHLHLDRATSFDPNHAPITCHPPLPFDECYTLANYILLYRSLPTTTEIQLVSFEAERGFEARESWQFDRKYKVIGLSQTFIVLGTQETGQNLWVLQLPSFRKMEVPMPEAYNEKALIASPSDDGMLHFITYYSQPQPEKQPKKESAFAYYGKSSKKETPGFYRFHQVNLQSTSDPRTQQIEAGDVLDPADEFEEEENTSVTVPKPAAKPEASSKPETKPEAAPKPAEATSKPAEVPQRVATPKPEAAKPAEVAKPVEVAKPAPAPAEAPKPAAAPQPAAPKPEAAKPVEAPKPEAAKSAEAPKAEAAKPAEAPKPAASPKPEAAKPSS